MSEVEVERLAQLAAERTGFRLEAVDRHALGRLVAAWEQEGRSPGDLVERASASSPDVLDRVLRVVSIGETYFFRHPEQLDALAAEAARRLAKSGRTRIRAWSAGCSTGEEAYSLAAALLAHVPAGIEVSVVGTDLLPSRIEHAVRGVYGRWSVRGPLAHAGCVQVRDDEHVEVTARMRQVTSFAAHNLLDPPPLASLDLVLCRNVLVYFAPAAARTVERTLVGALAADGLIAFGTVDVGPAPQGLSPAAASHLAIYGRAEPPRAEAPPRHAPSEGAAPDGARPQRPSLAPQARRSASIETHVVALRRLESGARDEARRLLDDLLVRDPAYLPALLERALVDSRGGDRTRAAQRMRQLLERLGELADDAPIDGPEILSAAYYRAAAQAFLNPAAEEEPR